MSKDSMYFTLDEIDGKKDVKQLKRELDTCPGVLAVSVNAQQDRLAVDFDTTGTDPQQIINKIETLGYTITGQVIERKVS